MAVSASRVGPLALILVYAVSLRAESPSAVTTKSIDAAVAQGLAQENIVPLPVCDDSTFLRRAWIDLAGRVPPLVEATSCQDARTPLDRAALVDKLLASKAFANHWGRLWTEHLTGRRPFEENQYNARVLFRYLRDAFDSGMRYDELTAELLRGEGASDVSGPANFLLRYDVDPAPLAGAVGQKFLGLTLQCAECHDHPHAGWKQQDFWGMAAYFGRLRKMQPTNPQPNENFLIVLERSRGELLAVDKKSPPDEQGNYPTKTVFPQLPGTPRRDRSPNRREALLAWMIADENPFFARNLANEMWQRLMGEKLVDSLDIAKAGDAAPSHPVLDAVAQELRACRFDMKQTLRSIVLSETYQRESGREEAGDAKSPERLELERRHFGRARIRPLSADQVHLSIAQAFGFRADDNDAKLADLTGEDFTYDLPIQSFGDSPASLRRSLALFNSDHLNGAVDIATQGAMRLHGESPGPEHIRRLFLSLVSRPATEDELDQFLNLAAADQPKSGLEDVAWVLLNSAEFNTNH